MTETTETEAIQSGSRGTVHYEFKLPLKQYMSATCSIYFPFEHGVSTADTIENAKEAFFHAKALVIQQLGLEFELDGDVVRATLEKSFGPVTDVTDAAKPTTVAAPVSASGGSLVIEHQWDGQPVPAWLFEQAAEAGVTKVSDVRRFLPENGGNGKAASPWFRAADGTKDQSGKWDMGFWPPKGA